MKEVQIGDKLYALIYGRIEVIGVTRVTPLTLGVTGNYMKRVDRASGSSPAVATSSGRAWYRTPDEAIDAKIKETHRHIESLEADIRKCEELRPKTATEVIQ